MSPMNALILPRHNGRFVLGPADPNAETLSLRIEGVGNILQQPLREVVLTRQDAAQVEHFLGLWLSPPLPPGDADAEQRVLGAILRKPAIFDVLEENYTAAVFVDPVHRTLWEVMDRLHHQGIVPDQVAVTRAVEGERSLEEVGGGSYVHHLASGTICGSATAVALMERIGRMAEEREAVRLGRARA